MTTKGTEVKSIDRILTHSGLIHIPDSVSGYTIDGQQTYKVKEGYELPVTSYKMVPTRYGYTRYKLDCVLPEDSRFSCSDKFCKEIISFSKPVINSETQSGMCYGNRCVDNDWGENFKNVKIGYMKYEL